MQEKFIKQKLQTRGSHLVFVQDEVELSNGNTALRDVLLHPGAVAILALTDQEELLLVQQYRYPVKQSLYEIPAGKLEKGEDPLASAQRELEEETGFQAKNWLKVAEFYTAPGFTDEIMHLYFAENLEEHLMHPDPDEIIEAHKIPLQTAYDMLQSGAIKDAKSMVGILWLIDHRRAKLR